MAPSTDSSSSGLEIAALAASDGAVLAAGRADAHQRGAGVVHDRAHVGEVEVDQAGDRDQVGDALDALAQDVVGLAERLEDRRAALDDRQQLLVRDDDQRVDVLAQALDALLGLAHALGALELERRVTTPTVSAPISFLAISAMTGRGAGAGAAALAGGDEDHVRALERLLDLVARLGRRAEARRPGFAPAPRPLVSSWPMLSLMSASHICERLGVGVGGDELDAAQAGVDHAVDRVGAAAADADDLDDREVAAAALHEGSSVRASS